MSAPRFLRIRLRYGIHEGEFSLPDVPRPIVLLGPNASGKTTLLEALVRTLYGFNRRAQAERDLAVSRSPWGGGQAQAEVELRAADGRRFRITRSFDTQEVVVTDETGTEVFSGEANPAGEGTDQRAYRELLGGWIGFSSFDPYRHTAWIGQGELVETDLGERLLSLAEGSHRRVEAAFNSLESSFEELCREPIAPGRSTRRVDRKLESARARLEEIEEELAEAREAEEERAPLLARLEELSGQIESLEAEIEALEASLEPLADREALELQRQQAEDAAERARAALRELEEAERTAERAEEAWGTAAAGGTYPDDFEAQLRELELLWERETRLRQQIVDLAARPEARRRAVDLVTGAGLALAGIAGWLAHLTIPAVILLTASILMLGAGVWRRLRATRAAEGESRLPRELEAELAGVESRVAEILASAGIPGLQPGSVEAHRGRFRHQREVAGRREAALRALASTMERLRGAAVPAGVGAAEATADDAPHAAGPGTSLFGRAAELRRRLEEAVDEARGRLAEATLRLERQAREGVELPDGVEPEPAAVRAALSQRRAEVRSLRDQRAGVDQALRDLSRQAERAPGLIDAREVQLRQVRELEDTVEAHRLAWSLIEDAYRAFRDRDQQRLLDAISERLEVLSSGVLGPVATEDGLDRATVRLGGRALPLSSPSLSFGQRHILHFAIRLGTADYLAQESVWHPLLIDEPFAHLDERNTRVLWELLVRVAGERQVVVATQSRLQLEGLGVDPDITLEPPAT